MPPTRRDQLLRELARRRDSFNPRQQAAMQELQKRGVLEPDTPEVTEELTIEDPRPALQRSLGSAFGAASKGLSPSDREALAGDRNSIQNQTKKLSRLLTKREEAFAEARSILTEAEQIPETPELSEFLKKAQLKGPIGKGLSSGFQQSILTTGAALSRGFQDEDKARELGDIAGKLAASDAEAGRLTKTIAGASRSFTDLLTGGGGVTAIPLFALKATNAAIDEGRSAGLSGSDLARFALTQGAIEGGVTAAFSLLGAGGAESALRAPIAQGFRKAAQQIGKGLLFEEMEEIGVEVGQRVNSFLSGVDAQALNADQLAEAVLDITLQTALFSTAAQGPGLAQSLAQRQTAETVTEAQPSDISTDVSEQAPQAVAPETAQEAQFIGEATQATPPATAQEAAFVGEDADALFETPPSEGREALVRDIAAGEKKVEISQLLSEPAPPTQVDQSGTPQEQESPAQTIQRTSGERSPEGTTSARKVDIAASREQLNNLLLRPQDTRTWEQAQQQAQEQNIPERAMELARSVNAVPRALSDIETAGVTQRVMAMMNEHNDIQSQIEQASPTEAKVLDAELRRIEEDHDVLTRAIDISGTEKGRALNSQKLTLNQRFELVSVLGRAKRAAGKDLNQRTRARLTQLTADIKRLQERLATLKERPESASPALTRVRNEQVEKLEFQRAEMQSRINRVIENQKPRTWTEIGIREPLSIMRALKSSFDVSAVGRQAGLATLANPGRALRNLKPMFQAMASERAQFRINEKIKNHPKFILAKRAGLRITDTSVGAALDQKEENYRSNLADRIPGVRMSDRAFSTFLNVMRMDGFDAMTDSLARNGEPTLDEATIIADTVNNFTGFGGLADMKKSSKVLNTVFWSPSLQLARLQVLTGRSLRKAPTARVRKLVAKEYGKTLLGLTILIALGKLAGFEVEENPKSSDFLKLKAGNTRIDVGAGITQFLVLGARQATGELKSPVSGRVRPIRGDDLRFGQEDASDVLFRFTRSKFTPGLGLAVDALAGQNVIGEKVDVFTPTGAAKVVANGLMPLSAQEIMDSFKEQDVPQALALSAMTLFGVGVQNFAPPQKTGKRGSQ